MIGMRVLQAQVAQSDSIRDLPNELDLPASCVDGGYTPVRLQDRQRHGWKARAGPDVQNRSHGKTTLLHPPQQRQRVGIVLDGRLDRLSDSRKVRHLVGLDHQHKMRMEPLDPGTGQRDIPTRNSRRQRFFKQVEAGQGGRCHIVVYESWCSRGGCEAAVRLVP